MHRSEQQTPTTTSGGDEVGEVGVLLDHLFRRESGRLVAMLTAKLGPAHLDMAEEVVQEALLEAFRLWPFGRIPDDPSGWLYRVARNRALDRLRRAASFRRKEEAIGRLQRTEEEPPQTRLPGEITDDQLRLIFLCCHPDLPLDGRVALTLRTVGGFSVAEIAHAFLVEEKALYQRISRTKKRIREAGLGFDLPSAESLEPRIDAVLEVIYLMFNSGYGVLDDSKEAGRLMRLDVCTEAIRLVEQLLATRPRGSARSSSPEPGRARWRPKAHALASLLHFQASRLAARVDARGEMVLLPDQDRSLWDRRAIDRAFFHLDRASSGPSLTSYHVQAAIASHHARSIHGMEVDWAAILDLYDRLLAIDPSPVVALNRVVAFSFVHGAELAWSELDRLAEGARLENYYLLHAIRGDLAERMGNSGAAGAAYGRAVGLAPSAPERRFLERRASAAEAEESTGGRDSPSPRATISGN